MKVAIYAGAIVLANNIGEDSVISSLSYIEENVEIGKRTKIKPGCLIFDGTQIGDDCFIGPGVKIFNDKKPPSKGEHWAKAIIGNNVSIGGGSNIAPGVKIGDGAKIRMGSNVTRDVKKEEYYRGE